MSSKVKFIITRKGKNTKIKIDKHTSTVNDLIKKYAKEIKSKEETIYLWKDGTILSRKALINDIISVSNNSDIILEEFKAEKRIISIEFANKSIQLNIFFPNCGSVSILKETIEYLPDFLVPPQVIIIKSKTQELVENNEVFKIDGDIIAFIPDYYYVNFTQNKKEWNRFVPVKWTIERIMSKVSTEKILFNGQSVQPNEELYQLQSNSSSKKIQLDCVSSTYFDKNVFIIDPCNENSFKYEIKKRTTALSIIEGHLKQNYKIEKDFSAHVKLLYDCRPIPHDTIIFQKFDKPLHIVYEEIAIRFYSPYKDDIEIICSPSKTCSTCISEFAYKFQTVSNNIIVQIDQSIQKKYKNNIPKPEELMNMEIIRILKFFPDQRIKIHYKSERIKRLIKFSNENSEIRFIFSGKETFGILRKEFSMKYNCDRSLIAFSNQESGGEEITDYLTTEEYNSESTIYVFKLENPIYFFQEYNNKIIHSIRFPTETTILQCSQELSRMFSNQFIIFHNSHQVKDGEFLTHYHDNPKFTIKKITSYSFLYMNKKISLTFKDVEMTRIDNVCKEIGKDLEVSPEIIVISYEGKKITNNRSYLHDYIDNMISSKEYVFDINISKEKSTIDVRVYQSRDQSFCIKKTFTEDETNIVSELVLKVASEFCIDENSITLKDGDNVIANDTMIKKLNNKTIDVCFNESLEFTYEYELNVIFPTNQEAKRIEFKDEGDSTILKVKEYILREIGSITKASVMVVKFWDQELGDDLKLGDLHFPNNIKFDVEIKQIIPKFVFYEFENGKYLFKKHLPLSKSISDIEKLIINKSQTLKPISLKMFLLRHESDHSHGHHKKDKRREVELESDKTIGDYYDKDRTTSKIRYIPTYEVVIHCFRNDDRKYPFEKNQRFQEVLIDPNIFIDIPYKWKLGRRNFHPTKEKYYQYEMTEFYKEGNNGKIIFHLLFKLVFEIESEVKEKYCCSDCTMGEIKRKLMKNNPSKPVLSYKEKELPDLMTVEEYLRESNQSPIVVSYEENDSISRTASMSQNTASTISPSPNESQDESITQHENENAAQQEDKAQEATIKAEDRVYKFQEPGKEIYSFPFPESATVRDAINKLAQEFDIDEESITLMFAGKTLRNEYKLNSLYIPKRGKIVMLIKSIEEIILVTASNLIMLRPPTKIEQLSEEFKNVSIIQLRYMLFKCNDNVEEAIELQRKYENDEDFSVEIDEEALECIKPQDIQNLRRMTTGKISNENLAMAYIMSDKDLNKTVQFINTKNKIT